MVILPSIRRKYMNPRIPHGETVQMSECVVTLASDRVTYTGSACTVGVAVTWGGEALSVNADYTLSFANNVNLGPATVTVTGMGQFAGSVTRTFYIVATPSGQPWTFDVSDATEVTNTSGGPVSSGSVPFCVRGGYLFSSQSDGTVVRWQYDDAERAFVSTGVHTASNGACRGFCLSRNGLHSYMYVNASNYSASGVDTVYMFDHATAWDVSDASPGYMTHDVKMPYALPKKSAWSDYAAAIDIDTTGTKIYAVMRSGYVHTSVLATPFDVTSAVEASLSTIDLETVAGITYLAGAQIAPDGRSLVLITSSGVVHTFGLSAAWDVSSIDTTSDRTFNTGLTGQTVYGIGVSDDASKMFVKISNGVKVYAVS